MQEIKMQELLPLLEMGVPKLWTFLVACEEVDEEEAWPPVFGRVILSIFRRLDKGNPVLCDEVAQYIHCCGFGAVTRCTTHRRRIFRRDARRREGTGLEILINTAEICGCNVLPSFFVI
jgi:hypothetical protein